METEARVAEATIWESGGADLVVGDLHTGESWPTSAWRSQARLAFGDCSTTSCTHSLHLAEQAGAVSAGCYW
jgi:hypothetical protein